MISLSASINSASPGLVRDIIFVEKELKWGFSCSLVMIDAQVSFEEVTAEHPGGGDIGQNIWDITGDIILYQNDFISARDFKKHEQKVFDVHILFFNGDVLSTMPYVKLKPSTVDKDVKSQYLFAENFRPLYGVVLKTTDGVGGGPRGLHYSLSGGTVEKTDWHASKDSDFYDLLPTTSIKLPTTGSGGS